MNTFGEHTFDNRVQDRPTLLYNGSIVGRSGYITLVTVPDTEIHHRKRAGDVLASIIAASLLNRNNGNPFSVRGFTAQHTRNVLYIETHRSTDEYLRITSKASRRARFEMNGFYHCTWVNHPEQQRVNPVTPTMVQEFILDRLGDTDVFILDAVADAIEGRELYSFLDKLQRLDHERPPLVILPVYEERDAALLYDYGLLSRTWAMLRVRPDEQHPTKTHLWQLTILKKQQAQVEQVG